MPTAELAVNSPETRADSTAARDAALADGASPLAAAAPACFHCGEPCPRGAPVADGRPFCCEGCRIVHDLLVSSGLAEFYALSERPGVRAPGRVPRNEFAWLNAPEVQERLLDFTDGRQSRVTFHVPAIHCVACVWLLENLFRLHPGIGPSEVNFARREVALSFAPQQIRLSELVALLASLGYAPELRLSELERARPRPARRRFWLQIGVAGFAFGNAMLLSFPHYLGLDARNAGAVGGLFGWLSLALALPSLLFSASDYWRAAWLAFRRRVVTLDVPIALGLAALYGWSFYEIAAGVGPGYCDSLTGLIFFLLCGRAFQTRAHERLAFDRDYRAFFPLAVTRVCGEGAARREERVAVSQLRVGDRLCIRNGELIPADARLVRGEGRLDYSFVTGESQPVTRSEGEHLYAGGRQVGAAIEVELLKPVSESYLASLWNHEAFRKERGDEFQTLTNRYARRFTWVVVGIALGAGVFWVVTGDASRGIKAFTSVLIVACPCALALAAPFTLGTAQRLLARQGLFLKNAQVLEHMARVNTVVFDKTGTLTAPGTASGVRFVPARAFDALPGNATPKRPHDSSVARGEAQPSGAAERETGEHSEFTEAEARWVQALARHSTHPLAVQLSEALANGHVPPPVDAFTETPGRGIAGRVAGHEVRLGSADWVGANGSAPEINGAGAAVHVAIDGRYRGAFALGQVLRPEAEALVRALKSRYALALVSGDQERERERFLALFGPQAAVRFRQSPFEKLDFIHGLQRSGRTVLMVGDGLNDAGALRQADVGVAVLEQLGGFAPASDVILEAPRLPLLAGALTLARRAVRIVRVGFAISAAYNVVGVSIAAAGALSPLVCAVLMPISSVSVVLVATVATTWAARQAGVRP